MDLINIYGCFCNRTRLRIISLLTRGPLCVCHLQSVLGETQVKVSKHLGYLKKHAMVEVSKEANWRVYRLVAKPSHALQANLACLQDCAQEDPIFQRDKRKLTKLRDELEADGSGCCDAPQSLKLLT